MSTLFALGSNGSGQLGIGHKKDVSVPKQAILPPAAANLHLRAVASGGNHTLLLDRSGSIFWSGDPGSGACGLSPDASSAAVFRSLRPSRDGDGGVRNEKAVLVAATWEASLIVQEDDEGKNTRLFSLGTGLKGELGLGELLVKSPTATLFKDFPPPGTQIVDLAASVSHVVAVLDDGSVYGWGNGRKGQLGLPPDIIFAPRKLPHIDFAVSRAVCGREFTCLFGSPSSGRLLVLGADKWSVQSGAPASIPEWFDIAAGWGSIYVLKADGAILAWGRNDHSQLPPAGLPPIQAISAGSEHVVALSREGDVLAWGWGEHGNCGPQVDVRKDVSGRANIIASSKFLPPSASVAGIGAGCATSWVHIAGYPTASEKDEPQDKGEAV